MPSMDAGFHPQHYLKQPFKTTTTTAKSQTHGEKVCRWVVEGLWEAAFLSLTLICFYS